MGQKEKVEQYKSMIKNWEETAIFHVDGLACANDTLVKYKAELAAIDEPKLGHGDYGYADAQTTFVCSQSNMRNKLEYVNKHGLVECGEPITPKVIGNLFTELEAMAEDKDKFTVANLHIGIDSFGCLFIKYYSREIAINKSDIPAFILGLRTLHATDLRKKHD